MANNLKEILLPLAGLSAVAAPFLAPALFGGEAAAAGAAGAAGAEGAAAAAPEGFLIPGTATPLATGAATTDLGLIGPGAAGPLAAGAGGLTQLASLTAPGVSDIPAGGAIPLTAPPATTPVTAAAAPAVSPIASPVGGSAAGAGALASPASGTPPGLGSGVLPDTLPAPGGGSVSTAAPPSVTNLYGGSTPTSAVPGVGTPPVSAGGTAAIPGTPGGGGFEGTGFSAGDVSAVSPDARQALAAYETAGGTPSASTTGKGLFGTDITGGDIAKYAPTAIGAGGLLYNMMNQPRFPSVESSIKPLQNVATNLGTQGTALAGYLQSGTLPPGVQTSINRASEEAKAAIRSKYAAMGGGAETSSAAVSDMAAVDQAASAQGANIAINLLKQGVSEEELSSGIFQTLLNTTLQQSQITGQAISNFAGSLVPRTVVNVPAGA